MCYFTFAFLVFLSLKHVTKNILILTHPKVLFVNFSVDNVEKD